MHPLFRYLVVCGALVGLAFGLFVVRFGERTAFGHFQATGKLRMENVLAEIKADLARRMADDERRKKKLRGGSRKKPIAELEKPLSPKEIDRVRKLERAAALLNAEPSATRKMAPPPRAPPQASTGSSGPRTRTDERIPAGQKGLDGILVSRVRHP